MDRKTEFRDWFQKVRRYVKHDLDCAIWREKYPVCDCGLDAVIRRIAKGDDRLTPSRLG